MGAGGGAPNSTSLLCRNIVRIEVLAAMLLGRNSSVQVGRRVLVIAADISLPVGSHCHQPSASIAGLSGFGVYLKAPAPDCIRISASSWENKRCL